MFLRGFLGCAFSLSSIGRTPHRDSTRCSLPPLVVARADVVELETMQSPDIPTEQAERRRLTDDDCEVPRERHLAMVARFSCFYFVRISASLFFFAFGAASLMVGVLCGSTSGSCDTVSNVEATVRSVVAAVIHEGQPPSTPLSIPPPDSPPLPTSCRSYA